MNFFLHHLALIYMYNIQMAKLILYLTEKEYTNNTNRSFSDSDDIYIDSDL